MCGRSTRSGSPRTPGFAVRVQRPRLHDPRPGARARGRSRRSPNSLAELIFEPCGLDPDRLPPGFPGDQYAVTEEGNAFERRMADWAGLDFDRLAHVFPPRRGQRRQRPLRAGGRERPRRSVLHGRRGRACWARCGCARGADDGRRVLSPAVGRARPQQPDAARRRPPGARVGAVQATGPTLGELGRADAGFFPPAASPWSPRSSGELLSPPSFGHTGFTGTSIWIDPALDDRRRAADQRHPSRGRPRQAGRTRCGRASPTLSSPR